jgi:hypothetical protein
MCLRMREIPALRPSVSARICAVPSVRAYLGRALKLLRMAHEADGRPLLKPVRPATWSSVERGKWGRDSLEQCMAALGASDVEVLQAAQWFAGQAVTGQPADLPAKLGSRNAEQIRELKRTALSNTAPASSAVTSPVRHSASDESAESSAPHGPEPAPMSQPRQALVDFARSILDDGDAIAAYDAILRELAARRSIQDEDATGQGPP